MSQKKKRKPKRKTLKNKADRLFSEWVRSIGYCEWCGKTKNQVQLQCSHIFSRRFLVTRWLPLNANCLCAGCHRKWHDKPIEAVEWIKGYMGEEVYNELRMIAKTSIKKVDFEQVVKDLQEGNPPYQHIDKQ